MVRAVFFFPFLSFHHFFFLVFNFFRFIDSHRSIAQSLHARSSFFFTPFFFTQKILFSRIFAISAKPYLTRVSANWQAKIGGFVVALFGVKSGFVVALF